jgi:hypothetical protein
MRRESENDETFLGDFSLLSQSTKTNAREPYVSKRSREELLNTIKIDEGELWSRWEEVHGSDGIIVVFRILRQL